MLICSYRNTFTNGVGKRNVQAGLVKTEQNTGVRGRRCSFSKTVESDRGAGNARPRGQVEKMAKTARAAPAGAPAGARLGPRDPRTRRAPERQGAGGARRGRVRVGGVAVRRTGRRHHPPAPPPPPGRRGTRARAAGCRSCGARQASSAARGGGTAGNGPGAARRPRRAGHPRTTRARLKNRTMNLGDSSSAREENPAERRQAAGRAAAGRGGRQQRKTQNWRHGAAARGARRAVSARRGAAVGSWNRRGAAWAKVGRCAEERKQRSTIKSAGRDTYQHIERQPTTSAKRPPWGRQAAAPRRALRRR